MSKIEKLIAEHCPKGVEFKELGELGEFYGGLSGKSKDDFSGGNAKFITYMNIFSNIAVNTDTKDFVKIDEGEKQNKIEYGDVLFTGSSETPDECGMSSVLATKTDEPLYLNSFCFGFRFHDKNLFLPEFSKYLFRDEEIRKQIAKTASGVTRFNVSKRRFAKIKIPLPPLDIQKEIAKILDNFTRLEAELEAELEARKKQYEHYRSELLTFEDGTERERERVRWAAISEICKISRGRVMSKDYLKTNAGEYPVYSSQTADDGVLGRINTYDYDGEYVTWTTDGANAGSIFYRNGKFSITNVCGLLKVKAGDVNTKFLAYILATVSKKYVSSGMGNPKLMSNVMANVKVQIPSLDEQNRIVGILDKFNALVSDISIGLPAEINARRSQYEYHRGKLLTFNEYVPA